MIDERHVREMLQRRAGAISTTSRDASTTIRRARRWARFSELVGAAAIVIVLAVAAAGGVRLLEPPAPIDQPAPTPTSVIPITPTDVVFVDIASGEQTPLPTSITSLGPTDMRVSPSRTQVTFVGGAGHDVFVASIDGSAIRQLTEDLNARDPSWSPDETTITFVSGGSIHVVDVTGGATTALTPDRGQAWAPTFSPDGSAIIFTAPTDSVDWQWLRLWSVPTDGGDVTEFMDHAALGSFSPDGTRIAFRCIALPGDRYSQVWVNDGVIVANVDGSGRIELPRLLVDDQCEGSGGTGLFPFATPPDWDAFLRPDWSPDGTRIAWSDDRTKVVDVDAGAARSVADGTHPSWVDDETLIVELPAPLRRRGSDGQGKEPS